VVILSIEEFQVLESALYLVIEGMPMRPIAYPIQEGDEISFIVQGVAPVENRQSTDNFQVQ